MTPWFGLHLPSYTFPGSPPERLFERVADQAPPPNRQDSASSR